MTGSSISPPSAEPVPRRVVAAVVLGTLLNPLNSSAIAVALVSVSKDFEVSLAATASLVLAFYATSAVAQPTMGRLADRFGARRTFVAGLAITTIACLLAPLAPSLPWLIAARMLMGIGTAAPYPAGLALIRAAAGPGRAPTRALGQIAFASNGAAALGPAVGGAAVALAGWEAVFLLNVPITLVGIAVALRWLPNPPGEPAHDGRAPRTVGLLALPALRGVYVRFTAITLGFYGILFGLPVWLEESRGFDASTAGLLMVPFAGVSMLALPAARRFIDRRGARRAIAVGGGLMAVGTLPLLGYDPGTSVVEIVLVGSLLGVSLAFLTLGLQTRLYDGAPAGRMGAASGLFQTCRSIGGILATVLIGTAFADAVDSASLHVIALVVAVLSAAVALSSTARTAR